MAAVAGQRLRLRYRKDDVLQYISHLDTLRLALRLFRSCAIPVAFGGKFAPKAKVNCGPPLPLGVSADNELLDLELQDGSEWCADDAQQALARMKQAVWPRDFAVELEILDAEAAPVSQLAVAGRYHLHFMGGQTDQLEATLQAGIAGYALEPVSKHPCQGILAATVADNCVSVAATATGNAVFSGVRCSAYLAGSCGSMIKRIHRECLLDSSGAAL